MNVGAFGENFPYTNFHDLNLDWIIKMVVEMTEKLDKAIASKITVADPIEWDLTKQYEPFTIVMDNDNAYLSLQAVPYGTPLTNTDYWQKIFDMSGIYENIQDAIALANDGDSTTSSANRSVNSLVWLHDDLYRVIAPISLGDTYSDQNTEVISVEEWVLVRLEETARSILNIFKRSRKAVIFIGDSYGLNDAYWQGWQSAFNTLYGNVITVYNSAIGGSAFKQGDATPNFNTQLESVLANLSAVEKQNITDVIAVGGYNDVAFGTTETELTTLMTQFKNTALTACPYAKVSVGFCGVHYANEGRMKDCRKYYQWYNDSANKSGMGFINGLIYVLLNKSLLFTTEGNPNANFHPNTDGNIQLATRLYNYLVNGTIGDVTYAELIFGNTKTNVYVRNGLLTMFPTSNPFLPTTGMSIASGQWYDMVDLSNTNLMWFFNPWPDIAPSNDCWLIFSGSNVGAHPPIPLQCRFINNKFQVGNLASLDTMVGSGSYYIKVPSFTLPWEAVY